MIIIIGDKKYALLLQSYRYLKVYFELNWHLPGKKDLFNSFIVKTKQTA